MYKLFCGLVISAFISGCTTVREYSIDITDYGVFVEGDIGPTALGPNKHLPSIVQRDTGGVYWIFMFKKAAYEIHELYEQAAKSETNIPFCVYGTTVKSIDRSTDEPIDGSDMIRISEVSKMTEGSCSNIETYLGKGRIEVERVKEGDAIGKLQDKDRLAFWNRTKDYVAIVIQDTYYYNGKLNIDFLWAFKDGRSKRWLWTEYDGDGFDPTVLPVYAVPEEIIQTDTQNIRKVSLTTKAATALAKFHERGTYVGLEQAFCMYGMYEELQDGYIHLTINRLTPARVIDAQAHKIYYHERYCNFTDNYLGRGHVHVAPDPEFGTPTPYLSRRDNSGFWKRQFSVLTLIAWKTSRTTENGEDRLIIWIDYRLRHGAGGAWVWESNDPVSQTVRNGVH